MLKNVNIAAYFIQCLDWYKKTPYIHSIITTTIFNNTFTNIKKKPPTNILLTKMMIAIIVIMHSSEVSWSMLNN